MERQIELAKFHSVPLLETCKALDWQHETEWCWVQLDNNWVIFPTSEIYYLKPDEYFHAPYMHEIINRLSSKGTLSINKVGIVFTSITGKAYVVGVTDNHIAEAFGQLCLLFRKNKVFKKYLEAETMNKNVNIKPI